MTDSSLCHCPPSKNLVFHLVWGAGWGREKRREREKSTRIQGKRERGKGEIKGYGEGKTE